MKTIAQLDQEQLVFVDVHGQPTGELGPKISSHTSATQLHLGFSCYLFNSQGELLVTKRATGKRIWPNVWTNTVCGHPAPGELFEDAIARRLEYELGLLPVDGLVKVVSEYIYTTPPYNNIIEHEFCPIFVGTLDAQPKLNPDEVDDYKWVKWQRLMDEVSKDSQNPGVYSFWMKDQLKILRTHPVVRELSQQT